MTGPELIAHAALGWSRRRFVRAGFGALAAPLLLGCSDDSPTEPDPTGPGGDPGPGTGPPPGTVSDPRLAARPGVPTLAATPGYSRLELEPGRDGFLYVPSGYDPGQDAPLLVTLHGAGSYADDWADYQAFADQRGFVLLAPDSRYFAWDIFEVGYFGPDVEFLDRALTHTFDRCRIDLERIALAGFSNGAGYAVSLGISNGDLFTHIIAHSSSMIAPRSPFVGWPRVYQSHGTYDPVLSIDVGRQVEDYLRAREYDVTFEEFEGGHELPHSISHGALDWFLDVS